MTRNLFSDCGTSGKQVARHFAAEDADATALVVILVIDPASDLQGDGAYLAEDRRNPRDLAVGAGVVADGADIVARDQRRNVHGELRLILDGEVVVIGKVDPLHGGEAALDRRGATAEKEDDVLAEGFELAPLSLA